MSPEEETIRVVHQEIILPFCVRGLGCGSEGSWDAMQYANTIVSLKTKPVPTFEKKNYVCVINKIYMLSIYILLTRKCIFSIGTNSINTKIMHHTKEV